MAVLGSDLLPLEELVVITHRFVGITAIVVIAVILVLYGLYAAQPGHLTPPH